MAVHDQFEVDGNMRRKIMSLQDFFDAAMPLLPNRD